MSADNSSSMTIRLEQTQDAVRLDPVLGPGPRKEIDDRLASIHRFFVEERAKGEKTLVRDFRLWSATHTRREDLDLILETARAVRERAKAVVVVGIGGSDLGARVVHEVLDAPYHNELPAKERGIDWRQRFVAVTGQNEKSALFRLNGKEGETPFLAMLPIQDGVGGRFSVHTEVGMLPALVTAPDPEARLRDAVEGLRFADDRFFRPWDDAENVAYRLAYAMHLHEVWGRRNALVFYNYSSDRALGDWFTQLLSESIQERGGGFDVLPVIGPTGNHSILNGIVRGPRNKLALFLGWDDLGEDLRIPRDTGIGGEMAAFEGLGMAQVQRASLTGTRDDLTANGVPNLLLRIGKRDARHLFALFRTLMDAIAIKGKLQYLDVSDEGVIDPSKDLTYQQYGVEGYKQRTREQASKMQDSESE